MKKHTDNLNAVRVYAYTSIDDRTFFQLLTYIGRLTVKTEPFPGTDSTSIDPP